MKIKASFFVSLLLISIVFFACTKEDTDINTEHGAPDLAFKTGENYIADEDTLSTSEEFILGIQASANQESQAKLKSILIKRSGWIVLDSIINNNEINWDISVEAMHAVGEETWEVTVVDENEKSATETISIYTVENENNGPPELVIVEGIDYISGDTILQTGEEFRVRINTFSNTASGAELVNFKVTRVFQNNPQIVIDSSINVNNFQFELISNTQQQAGSEVWLFEVTDNNGESAEANFTITTENATGNILEYPQIILGSYNANIGAAFALTNDNAEVYILSEAKANSMYVDFMYYWDEEATRNATLVTPANPVAAQVFSNIIYGVATWIYRNDTKFKLIEEAVDWDSITDDTRIIELATDFNDNIVYDLNVGDVIAFETDEDKTEFGGKKGLIMITDINVGAAGSITFDVKVQE